MNADRGTGAADLFAQRQTGCETGPGGDPEGTPYVFIWYTVTEPTALHDLDEDKSDSIVCTRALGR